MEERAVFSRIPFSLLTLLIASVVLVTSQSLTGPSIDCGSDVNYTDPNTTITWTTDAGFIKTGINVQGITVKSNETIVNGRQASSLRYFDQGRGRDCYVLPVESGNYLVRLSFYYGNWASPDNYSNFDVYLNGNQWLIFNFDGQGHKHMTYAFEAVVNMPRNPFDVCLVRRRGIPFISAIELRKLASGMYSAVVENNKFLGKLIRLNTGAGPGGAPYVRYPDDAFDRLWSTPHDNATHIRSKNNVSTSPPMPEIPPEKVMEDASIYYGYNYQEWLTNVGSTVGNVAIYSYFQEVDNSTSPTNVRGMNYYINELPYGTFNSTHDPYEYATCVLDIQDDTINLTLTSASWSKLPPIINAFEIYLVYDWNGSTTYDQDVESLQILQSLLNLTDWLGDPCIPIPYDWLGCSFENTSQGNSMITNNQTKSNVGSVYDKANITGISLASIVTIQTLPQEIANFTALSYLDVSNTSLTSIPSSSLSGLQYLTILDISNNRVGGAIMDFLNSIPVRNLQIINASNNLFTGEFSLDQLHTDFPNLQAGAFDNNPNITGILNMTSFYNTLQSLQSGNSSTNAAVDEADATPTASGPSSPLGAVVSLTNSGITGINPSLDAMAPLITSYLRSLSPMSFLTVPGVLLGGSSFCNQPMSGNLPLNYLCRLSVKEPLSNQTLSPSKSSNTGAVAGAVVGGVVGFTALVTCILGLFVYRLRKQNSELKNIQEALAKQRVQPPFYSYSDLRAATNDFSQGNELGRGAFGAVYKGEIKDTANGPAQVVAVKQLYSSNQALSEFLNEAVLITGIKHRNLVQLKGICIHKDQQRLLVYEFAENGNVGEALWDAPIDKKERFGTMLDWQQRLKVCVGIARGLSYLHEELQPRLIHRDIKPGNILLDKNFEAKIADFGLARSMMEEQTEADFTRVAGTQGYLSPEYATLGQLSEKVDVYAFGIVLLEIVSGRKSIDLSQPDDQKYLQSWAKQLKSQGKELDILDPTVKKTANKEEVSRVIAIAFLCVDPTPSMRPTMPEAVTMLHGITDVALHRPEPDTSATAFRRGEPFGYTKLSPTLVHLNEDATTESFDLTDMSASSSATNNNDLELSKLSAR